VYRNGEWIYRRRSRATARSAAREPSRTEEGTMALQDLSDLYLDQIRDLYSAETQIVDSLPKMIEAASHDQLRAGFQRHLDQTREHVRRLERIAEQLGEDPDGKTCHGMKGLLKEAKETMKERADSDVLDAAIIADAQRVEHYEIAAYGCARTYAEALNRMNDAHVLQETLDEEAATDHALTDIALRVVNPDAGARNTDSARLADVDVTPAAAREVGRSSSADRQPSHDAEAEKDNPYASGSNPP
jgi:ferritin-like metal-binding protein YciE